jgi:hypothetical protein
MPNDHLKELFDQVLKAVESEDIKIIHLDKDGEKAEEESKSKVLNIHLKVWVE